jgi:hypothetical protein
MAFALPIIGLVGAGFTALGTIAKGAAEKNALLYQQQVANENAIIAQQNAQYTIEAGQAKTAAKSMEYAAEGGAIKTAEAAGGVDVNTGSNKATQISQRELRKLDTEQEMNKAQLAAYGYRTQATNYQAQAALYGYEAPQALKGAELGAAGQFTGAAAKWFSPSGFTTT